MATSWRTTCYNAAMYMLIPVLLAALWLRRSVDPFDVDKVLAEGIRVTSRSWEYGTLAEAMLELSNPELAVFSQEPFKRGGLPCGFDVSDVAALQCAMPLLWTNGTYELTGGEGSPADPASLGVAALLLSCHDQIYSEAAQRQAEYLMENATRFRLDAAHAAISHRDHPPQLWGDFVYMVPPFLAYYGAATSDITYMKEAVRQCELYARILTTNILLPNGTSCVGLWRHIVSHPAELEPDVCCSDPYVWLTSNCWAVAGMARVLATISRWHPPDDSLIDPDAYQQFVADSRASLVRLITRMTDCLLSQSRDENSSLLKNYLDAEGSPCVKWAFGDAAGTALVTSAMYRLAVLVPEQFGTPRYLDWAHENFDAVAKHVDGNGRVGPVAGVDGVPSKHADDQTSEGQSMAILMYAARRDCVRAGVCRLSWWETVLWVGSKES